MSDSLSQRLQRLIRPEIQALSAYHVPDPFDCIKLDAMENPYGWNDAVRAQWLSELRNVALNRYPDPAARELQQALRRSMGLAAEFGLLLGNGSDELIQILALALAKPGAVLLAPEPGFVMYKMIARFVGMAYIGVPLREDFSLDRPAMLAAIAQHQPALIFLAYPNNPTGNQFSRDDMQAVIEVAPGLVVVDEAYHVFADDSFLADLSRYDNLLVMRTLSKMGLAGLRLGLLMADKRWLGELDKLRLPYNINVLTQVSARFALQHQAMFDQQIAAIRAERTRLAQALATVPGLRVYPSQANFLLLRTPAGQATRIFDFLKANKVLIKNLNGGHPLLSDCLRVTVGTPAENDALLAALRAAMQ